jgi:hypothetical protein
MLPKVTSIRCRRPTEREICALCFAENFRVKFWFWNDDDLKTSLVVQKNRREEDHNQRRIQHEAVGAQAQAPWSYQKGK